MQRAASYESPEAYVAALDGWRRECVSTLRSAVRKSRALDERLKWGHLVYFANGPVLMLRAEGARVLFGFWRGKRLRDIEPRLKPGGKYEMATVELHEGDTVRPTTVRRLVAQAIVLNEQLGDPTKIAGAAQPKRHEK